MRTTRRLAALAAVATLAAAGCTSSDPGAGGATADSTPTGVTDGDPLASPAAWDTWERPACTVDRPAPPATTPVPDVASDLDLTSFDGTTIRIHWFPHPDASPDDPKPTVLMGPGWSLPGDTTVDSVDVLATLSISGLREAGFNVLTWDPRGFGESGGAANVNDPDLEGRDVQGLLDWVAAQPEARTDAPSDPRVGMVGASYGGGIQLTTAGIDCRIEALVPVVAWYSLDTALYPNDTAKSGWGGLLANVGAAGGTVAPEVTAAAEVSATTGVAPQEVQDWFVSRGPGDLVDAIRTPTLLVHGTVDTLFTPGEAITNFGILEGNGVPVGMTWWCGGHGACLSSDGSDAATSAAALAWLRHWVADEDVDLGPAVVVVDQDGGRWATDTWPVTPDEMVRAQGSGTLELTEASAAGPLTEAPDGVLGSLVTSITPAPAEVAASVRIDAPGDDALVVGAPELRLDYTGTSPDGERPTRVFAQLVDDETGLVLGNQITAVPLVLDGTAQSVTVPLEVVSHLLRSGTSVTLQLVATTPAYATPRLGGSVEFTSIAVELPVRRAFQPLG